MSALLIRYPHKGDDQLLLRMTMESDKSYIELPLHYNHLIQAALYKLLDPDFATFLHEEGYIHGKRHFKLFTFSQLQGKCRIMRDEKRIRFFNPVSLTVCSPLSPFCQGVMNAIVKENGLTLGHTRLNVTHIECSQNQVEDRTIIVNALSPITVYSTVLRPDGRKYTLYFHPSEKDFPEQIQQNILKKFDLVYQGTPSSPRFEIEPAGKVRQRTVIYKGFIIKGYMGKFKLSADDPRLLVLALDASLGAKGSQGFGCIEQVDTRLDGSEKDVG